MAAMRSSEVVAHGTHSEDRLDYRVKVELKVLYIQEVEGRVTHPLLVQIGKAYVACFSVICPRDMKSCLIRRIHHL